MEGVQWMSHSDAPNHSLRWGLPLCDSSRDEEGSLSTNERLQGGYSERISGVAITIACGNTTHEVTGYRLGKYFFTDVYNVE